MRIKSNRELKKLYHELKSGDIFTGTLSSGHLKQSIMVDLLERGVHCFPSFLSQALSNSKAAQAFVLKNKMLPDTCVIVRRTDLIEAINQYNKNKIVPVVTKEDHMHCGYGIRKWETVENLYSHMALSASSYPFVLQPFLKNFTDIRIIIVKDYIEAYVRYNSNNFRMNISAGGVSYPYELDNDKEKFCRSIMERGKFPFAHIDLLITESGNYYLSEIALNGGIKGASISRKDLDRKKHDVLENLAIGI